MVRGRLSCTEEASIALLKLVKQLEAQICCVAGTDAYQIRRNAWQRVADELNAHFQLEIPAMRWKKKFRNIQASAKIKIKKNLERIANHVPFLPLTAVEEEFSRSFNYARRMRREHRQRAPPDENPPPAVDVKPDLIQPPLQSITEGTGDGGDGIGTQLHPALQLFATQHSLFGSNVEGQLHCQQHQEPCSSTAIVVQQTAPIPITLPGIHEFANGEVALGRDADDEDEESLRKLKREVLELKKRDLIEKQRRRMEQRDENRRMISLLEDIKSHLLSSNKSMRVSRM